MLTKAEITRLRSLRDKKQRDTLGLFVVEGEKVVTELLTAGETFAEVYATAGWCGSGLAVGQVHTVTEDEMGRISHFPTPSSILAVGHILRAELDPLALDRGLTLLLDGIQDAGNLGTLLRIADWFAFDRVLASPDCVDVFNQKVINASMGSFRRVKVFSVDPAVALGNISIPVLGCDLAGDDVHALPPLRDAVVAIGSEGRGLSPAVRQRVTRFVTIPRFGLAESLNAAVAAAIVCDNLRRTAG
jgi:TrmH family RNA methyltransferase